MCVSLCHRRKLLYFNHEDCHPAQCAFTQPTGSCADCRHRQGALCGLTRAALPTDGGCCHFNVTLIADEVLLVTRTTLALLGVRERERIETALEAYDVYYEVTGDGVSVPIVDLAIPDIYGRGTEPSFAEVEPGNFGGFEWEDFEFDW